MFMAFERLPVCPGTNVTVHILVLQPAEPHFAYLAYDVNWTYLGQDIAQCCVPLEKVMKLRVP